MATQEPIIKRYKKNPILTKEDVPYPVATVHNAGIVKHNGRYIMLFRSHLHNGRSIIGRADSEDGFSFTVHPEPFLTPAKDTIFADYEEFGVEDLRINPMEGEYLLTYSAYSRHGVRIGLARTKDFENIERIALDHPGRPSQCGYFPGEIPRTIRASGPAAFRNFTLVHLDFLFPGPGALGRFTGDYEAGSLSLG